MKGVLCLISTALILAACTQFPPKTAPAVTSAEKPVVPAPVQAKPEPAPEKPAADPAPKKPAEDKPEVPRAAPRKPVAAVELPGSVASGPLMMLKSPADYASRPRPVPPKKPPVPESIPAGWTGVSPAMNGSR